MKKPHPRYLLLALLTFFAISCKESGSSSSEKHLILLHQNVLSPSAKLGEEYRFLSAGTEGRDIYSVQLVWTSGDRKEFLDVEVELGASLSDVGHAYLQRQSNHQKTFRSRYERVDDLGERAHLLSGDPPVLVFQRANVIVAVQGEKDAEAVRKLAELLHKRVVALNEGERIDVSKMPPVEEPPTPVRS